ncbi:hypothetical protein OC846_003880 [Tilletia horrida]|uniref:PX domain-containing protein n=1 Tax=Tilletia horrida TaxID=155126 RepID=A0AAN6GQR6_9BASI|nr:hypothetical protein OC846_003880 [Tilletia horrida]
MQSPISPSSSLGSVSSASRGTTRQPPPPRPQKPLHLTVRSKPTASNHTQWDSQATIKANHTGGGASTASAADSLYYSPSPSVLHSREPSLLLPDDTGIASAGFAIASAPSSGFLHQHNAHEIAQSITKTTELKLVNSRLGRNNKSHDDDDEDDEDDIEDIDSFLGDDEPQQHLSNLPLSPRRAASPLSATSPTTSSPLSIAAAAAAAAAISSDAHAPAPGSSEATGIPSPDLRQSPARPRDSGIEQFLREDKENDDLSFNQTIRPQRADLDDRGPHKPLRHQQQHQRLPKVLKRTPLAAPPSLERILRAEPEQIPDSPVALEGEPIQDEQPQPVQLPSVEHEAHGLEAIDEHVHDGESSIPQRLHEDSEVLQPQMLVPTANEHLHEGPAERASFEDSNDYHQAEPGPAPDQYQRDHAIQQHDADHAFRQDEEPASNPPPTIEEPPHDEQQDQYQHSYQEGHLAQDQQLWSLPETSEQRQWQQEQAPNYHQEGQWYQSDQYDYDQQQHQPHPDEQHYHGQPQQQDRIPSLVATSSAYSLGPPYHINNHITEPRGPFLHAIDLRPTIPQDQQPAGLASTLPSKKAKDSTQSASSAAVSKPGYLASLLSFGGKSLNRYAPFVASGAEDWIMCTEAGAGIEAPPGADLSLGSSQNYEEGDDDEDDSYNADGSYNTGSTWGRSSTVGRSAKRRVSQRPRQSDQQRQSHTNSDLASLSISELSRSSRRSNTDISHHLVLSGPAGPRWKPRSTPFHVSVHSPVKIKKLNGMHEYTLYTITSTYPPFEVPQKRRKRAVGEGGASNDGELGDDAMHYAMPYDPVLPPHPPGHTLTVTRRYSQFAWLARVLAARYPALVLPPLPSKQYAGRFASEFIETRRADLELWLSRVVRHPICRYEEAVIFFLSEEVEDGSGSGAGSGGNGESEWKKKEAELEAVPRMEIVSGIGPNGAYSTIGRKGMPIHMVTSSTSKHAQGKAAPNTNGTHKPVVVLEGAPTFFASTFHPDFNLDVNDAAAEAKALEAFSDAYERAMMLEPGGGMGGCMPSSYSAASGGGGGASSSAGSGAGGTGGGGSVSSAAAATSTVGALASAMADSAGPRAVPPRGCPAAGSVGVLPAWRGLRESTALRADSYRDLSFSILRLLTGRGLGLPEDQVGPLSSASMASLAGKEGGTASKHMSTASGHGNNRGPSVLHRPHASPATNEEGGWCWREGCTECVALTKSMQYVAQALQHVADEHEDHTRLALMRQHERLKAIGRPRLAVDKLLQVHHSTTAKYREATGERAEDTEGHTAQAQHLTQTERELMAARCETVLNVTMSEMDRIHNERTEDWTAWGKHWLDDEIAHYERCLETLRNARAAFEPGSWEYYAQEGPVAPTPHDARLYSTRRSALPIPMPSPPWAPAGMTATALRPVSLATEVVREGVTKFTYLFGGGGGGGGGSTAGTPSASSVAASPAALPTIRESDQPYFG